VELETACHLGRVGSDRGGHLALVAGCGEAGKLRREARGGGGAAASAPFALLGCLAVAGAGGRRRRRIEIDRV